MRSGSVKEETVVRFQQKIKNKHKAANRSVASEDRSIIGPDICAAPRGDCCLITPAAVLVFPRRDDSVARGAARASIGSSSLRDGAFALESPPTSAVGDNRARKGDQ